MLSSEFQSHSIKIEDFKNITINSFNPISIKRGNEIFKLLLGMSYNMPKMLSSEFQSHSIKIEDFKNIAYNSFNPFSIKRRNGFFKLNTRNFL